MKYMREALKQAKYAREKGEVPVGCIIVQNDRIIARAYNQTVQLHDPTAHAEMIAITQAAESLQNERLSNTTMYVTIEPCPMCAGAIILARIGRVVYGTNEPKWGAAGSLYDILQDGKLNHTPEVSGGILREDCSAILQAFFADKRKKFAEN
ncbi:MAG: tRNA adenosine(34) deaminase TadA [Planctomycetota bacterium]